MNESMPCYRRVGSRVLLGAALALSFTPVTAQPATTTQQAEIGALIQELDYLIEHTERLAARYRSDAAPIRFNYPALLTQLRLTRARSAAYLHEVHQVVQATPPAPQGASLTRRR